MLGGGQTIADVVPLPHPTVSEIMSVVAAHFGRTMIDMVSQRRAREVARPRQVAMYLTIRLTPMSLPQIGRIFGNRDHTTVIHARRQIEKLIVSDLDLCAAVDAIEQQIVRGEGHEPVRNQQA